MTDKIQFINIPALKELAEIAIAAARSGSCEAVFNATLSGFDLRLILVSDKELLRLSRQGDSLEFKFGKHGFCNMCNSIWNGKDVGRSTALEWAIEILKQIKLDLQVPVAAKPAKVKVEADKKKPDSAVVREIIERELKSVGQLTTQYLIDQIQITIDKDRLIEKWQSWGVPGAADESAKLYLGAKRVFADSQRNLKKLFELHSDGWITPIGSKSPLTEAPTIAPESIPVEHDPNMSQADLLIAIYQNNYFLDGLDSLDDLIYTAAQDYAIRIADDSGIEDDEAIDTLACQIQRDMMTEYGLTWLLEDAP